MMSQGGVPTRTRSLKERLRDGINFTWHYFDVDAPRRDGFENRGKSKSVDHSAFHPLDHESITKRVSENILSPTTEQPAHGEDVEPKGEKSRKVSPPPGTLTYTVQGSDTLSAIAARFGTTPSELTKLNRLTSRFVFPGQTLYVPEKKTQTETSRGSSLSESAGERDLMDIIRPPSPRPGRLERVRTPSSPRASTDQSCEEESYMDKDCLQKFLKINVRHITDGQGVVCGVLLVTPNAIMFDPNVSDPLVIEHGPEAYGVIAPMDLVVNAALYHDIAHMRVKDAEDIPSEDIPKPEVYRSTLTVGTGMVEIKQPSTETEASPKDVTLPLSQRSSPSSNSSQREGGAFPKAFDEGLVTPENSPVTEEEKKESDKVTELQQSAPSSAKQTQPKSRHESGFFDWDVVPEEPDGDPLPSSAPMQVTPPATRDSAVCDVDDTTQSTQSSAENTQEASNRGSGAQAIAQQVSCDSRPGVRLRSTDGVHTPPPQIESKKQKVFKRLSQPLTWMESLSGEVLQRDTQSAPPSSDPVQHSVFAKVFSSSPKNFVDFGSGLFTKSPEDCTKVRDVSETSTHNEATTDITDTKGGASLDVKHYVKKPHQQQQGGKDGKLGWKSMVSVEDMPDLFAAFDKLIPKPAPCNDDPPLYLRLRMGKPVTKTIPKSTPMMSYGKKRMRPEYWFSIPKARVDDLYEFFMLWAAEIYGDLDEATVVERGYQLIDTDTDLFTDEDRGDGEGGITDGIHVNIKESWEDEARRIPAYSWSMSSIDTEYMPDLVGTTDILQDDVRKELAKNLPARAEGYSWQLLFSTSQHGFSLSSLYRKMEEVDTPVLLVVQDTRNYVFGAMLSSAPRLCEHFYGNGESFLFTFYPEFRVYNWSGENTYFVRGEVDTLSIGSGEGHSGLLLDGDLYQGRTQKCATYNNDLLTASEDFIVKALECWGFV